MIFEPVYENISALCAKNETPVQAVVENSFTLEKGEEVLKIDCECKVFKSEVEGGFAKAEGQVEYKVLYLDYDGGLKCEKFSADFNVKTQAVGNCSEVSAKCVVADTGISAQRGNGLSIASVLEVVFSFFNKDSIVALSPSSAGFYTKTASERYIERKRKERIRTEYALSEKTVMEEVVFSKATVVITKRSPMVECVNVEGEIILECVGIKGGEVCSQTVCQPFTEAFECEGARYEDIPLIEATVTYCDALAVSQADANRIDGVVKCVFDLSLFRESEFECVTAVFSEKKNLLPTLKSHNVCEKIGNYTVMERVDGSVTLAENMPICDVVLSACAFECIINTAKSEDGCIKIDGVVVGRVIYSCASPAKTLSANVSLPFSISALLPVRSGECVQIEGKVNNVNCRVRRGSEFDIRADIALEVVAFSNKDIAVISELTEGEDLVAPTSAFSVYIAEGGESLWEVAGGLGVAPDVITQNTSINFPLAKGDRITVYRALDSKKI